MYTLIGKYVYVMAASYAYAGKLVEVTEEGIKIEDPSIVYDTGPWDAADLSVKRFLAGLAGHVQTYLASI